ncbi:hypothetical protein [Brevifollis gellanilyticus]|nr:hypothetical protein [Brevifollis gellanilyticus]
MRALWVDLWRRRWFRWTFTPVASIALSWCCICLILNYVGERRWQQVKARLEAEGETLDYFSLLPASISDEQNFCAIEGLLGLRDPENEALRTEIERQAALITPQIKEAMPLPGLGQAATTNDQAFLQALSLWAEHLAQPGKRTRKVVPAAINGAPLPGLPGLPSAGSSPPSTPEASQPATVAVTWKEARLLLEKHAPLLPLLTQATRQRRKAEYLPRPTRENLPELLYSKPLKHLQAGQGLGELCIFYSLVCMKAGDKAASLDAALVSLRLAQAANMDATLVGSLTCSNQQTSFIRVIKVYLRERFLEETDLALIQQDLQEMDPAAQHLLGLRAEMIWRANCIDYLYAHREQRWGTLRNLPMIGSSSVASGIAPAWVAVAPKGYFSLSKASGTAFFFDRAIAPIKQGGLEKAEARIGYVEDQLANISDWQRPDLFLTKMGFPPLAPLRRGVALGASWRLQAILACALERHYLRHRSYPASLEKLDAEFKAGASLLDVDGLPMHYVQSSDGRFQLWSPGLDGVDDGGKFGEEVVPGSPKSLTNTRYEGDWVWRYEPSVDKK